METALKPKTRKIKKERKHRSMKNVKKEIRKLNLGVDPIIGNHSMRRMAINHATKQYQYINNTDDVDLAFQNVKMSDNAVNVLRSSGEAWIGKILSFASELAKNRSRKAVVRSREIALCALLLHPNMVDQTNFDPSLW